MGQTDYVWKKYFKDKKHFADLFNGICWQGQEVIRPETLEELSEIEIFPEAKNQIGGLQLKENTRDIKMRVADKGIFRLLAIENQNQVDYSMPFRNMWYDVLDYRSQINEIKKVNKETNDYLTGAERLCGVKKANKLIPLFTVCVYHGEEYWDGPRSLRDMMCEDALEGPYEQLFADYPFHLYCVNEESSVDGFSPEIKRIFQILRYRRDKKQMLNFLETEGAYLDEESLELIAITLKLPMLWEHREEFGDKEGYNMCQAIRELIEDGKMEGKAEDIRNLMITLKLSVEAAMSALLIPEEEWEKYRALSCVQKESM